MQMSEGLEREKECEAAGRTDMLARLLGFVTPERLVRNMSFPSDAGRLDITIFITQSEKTGIYWSKTFRPKIFTQLMVFNNNIQYRQ